MPSITEATDADFEAISAWLAEERRATGAGFHCNLNVIASAHKDSELLVSLEAGNPVAFLAYGLTMSGILETRPDRRGAGHARALVEEAVRRAMEKDEYCILDIECAPTSSAPFWQRMGFTLYGQADPSVLGQIYAYRQLARRRDLPVGAPAQIEIGRYFDPDQHYRDSARPAEVTVPAAIRTADRTIKLGERIIFSPQYELPRSDQRDPVARIIVDGKEIYFDKAKYDDAKRFGIKSDRYGVHYLDEIRLP